MGYEVKVLADSISPAGHRITSFEATFPRIVLAEFNTHCMLGRNSASSRATPVAGRVAAVMSDPFVPKAFGRNQKGMQPGEALEGEEAEAAKAWWLLARDANATYATALAGMEVHKQYANRVIEPFSWHTAVITATDWDNFFHLRVSPMAQGEIREAAELMQAAREASTPRALNHGEWHLPYVSADEAWGLEVHAIDPVKVSVARCARVSYGKVNPRSPLEDAKMFDEKLLGPGHMSPLEHAARAMNPFELRMTRTFDVAFNGGPMLRTGGWIPDHSPEIGDTTYFGTEPMKITSVRGPLHYCAKLNGWISRRAFVPNEWDIMGDK